ncbi:cutinase [Stachybotrys elegans]|uniref:Cutinase n=1 Tax=Stachybotrys elegans TaxID=80388 RepID=A0A8K0SJK1_9HYPO|nr:cutinase [Stachybotrys elegans]
MKTSQLFLALSAFGAALAGPIANEAVAVNTLETDTKFPLAALEDWFISKLDESEDTEAHLHARQYASSTSNQLIDGTACRRVTLIYARGTTQAGNIGDPAAVGPLFFNSLASRIGVSSLAVQGVTYAANIAGFLIGGDPAGSRTMAQLAERAVTQCPNTRIVLSGYSQGAQLVHNAANQLSAAVANRITAVLTFGDPKRDQGFGAIPASRTRVICRTGDNICDGGINPGGEHTRYQQNADEAAAWVAARV